MAAYIDITVPTMADPIYGLAQAQPRDVFNFMKANHQPLDLVGRFEYLPILADKVNVGDAVGMLDGVEMIISDEVLYYEEPMLSGQLRRYAKIKTFLGIFGTFGRSAGVSVVEAIKNLGYVDGEILLEWSSVESVEFSRALGLKDDAFDPADFNYGLLFEFRAGAPRYMHDEASLMDAPHDGREYVRLNGQWELSDHFAHPDIDGGNAII